MPEVFGVNTISTATCNALEEEVKRVWLHDKIFSDPATQVRLDEIAQIALAGQQHEVQYGSSLAGLQQWAWLVRAAMHPQNFFGDTAHMLPVATLSWKEK